MCFHGRVLRINWRVSWSEEKRLHTRADQDLQDRWKSRTMKEQWTSCVLSSHKTFEREFQTVSDLELYHKKKITSMKIFLKFSKSTHHAELHILAWCLLYCSMKSLITLMLQLIKVEIYLIIPQGSIKFYLELQCYVRLILTASRCVCVCVCQDGIPAKEICSF